MNRRRIYHGVTKGDKNDLIKGKKPSCSGYRIQAKYRGII
jgi:hypothetical protein